MKVSYKTKQVLVIALTAGLAAIVAEHVLKPGLKKSIKTR